MRGGFATTAIKDGCFNFYEDALETQATPKRRTEFWAGQSVPKHQTRNGGHKRGK